MYFRQGLIINNFTKFENCYAVHSILNLHCVLMDGLTCLD